MAPCGWAPSWAGASWPSTTRPARWQARWPAAVVAVLAETALMAVMTVLAVMDVNMSTLGATLYSDVKPIFERKDRFA